MKPTPIDKALLTTLQAVPGLGQKKALSLLTQYGSIEQISKASTASLSTVVGKANAQQVKDFFQQAIHGGKRRSTLSLTEVEQMANKNENANDTEEEEIVTK
ncbi:Fanconi anemia core complex-associated protein 24 [Acropora cervicornis]|uniref:Fanconi anemia core complex-associated protein 24 n=1 Tax=Acropora cervicornis TaxID=6130 RepID=A0AAD9V9R3_ACRCE|nr:Fanconi anemia core complex-associated protein 24 [Acropora cervicornis]